MPRGKRRVVEMSTEDIRAKIESNSAKISDLTNEIKSLKVENKILVKDLVIAETREKEEMAKKETEEIVELIKNSGKSIEEIKEIFKQ